MIEPRASVVQFANGLIGDGELVSGDAERITRALYTGLARLVGAHGFDVLLTRALVLARRAHPVLDGVVPGPEGSLKGFPERIASASAAKDAAVAIVANFVELLAVLVGEDLTMRLVADVRIVEENRASPEKEKT